MKSFMETMRMIKIEHSIFAMPFALVGAFWAANGLPEMRVLGLVIIAMVTARSAAMGFNRALDADVDAKNPRTAIRSIPAGKLSKTYAYGFTLTMCFLFVLTCHFLNELCLMLSPLVLVVLLGYSATKRFTSISHFVLGLGLGLAPVGAWVAVSGTLDLRPVWLGLLVMAWTAGFDLIYACQDIDFDRKHGLHSVPAKIGQKNSLRLAKLLHLVVVGGFFYFGMTYFPHPVYWTGFIIMVGCLGYEHYLVWDGDLSKVDLAFFTMNGAVSLLFGVSALWTILLA